MKHTKEERQEIGRRIYDGEISVIRQPKHTALATRRHGTT